MPFPPAAAPAEKKKAALAEVPAKDPVEADEDESETSPEAKNPAAHHASMAQEHKMKAAQAESRPIAQAHKAAAFVHTVAANAAKAGHYSPEHEKTAKAVSEIANKMSSGSTNPP